MNILLLTIKRGISFNKSAFLLLEKTATHMQDPFENRPTDTPMTAISRKIEINIKNLINETEIPQAHEPENYYLT